MHAGSTTPSPRRRAGLPAALLAVLAALALVAAACGDDGDSGASGGGNGGGGEAACPVGAFEDAEGTTEITVWHAWVGLTQRTLEEIAADYNASQDRVEVKVEAQGNYEEMLAKYEAAIGDPATLPDVVLSEDTTVRFMIDSQTILPAQACIDADDEAQEFYDQVLPAVIAGYTVEDQLWPAAFSVSQAILYVNEAHLEQANLPTGAEELPGTLDELRATAEALRDAGVTDQPLVMRLDSWLLENLLSGAEQPIVDEDNGRSGIATESLLANELTTETYEWFKAMYDDGLLNAIPYSNPYDQLFAMALGTSSMLIDTSTAITSVNGAIEGTLTNEELGAEDLDIDLSTIQLGDLRIGVGLNPGFEEPGKGQIGGAGWYMVDSGDDARTSASWDFLSFFNETPNQVRWTLEGSYLPVSESAREDPTLVEEFETTRRGNWLAVASESLERLNPDFPGPVFGPYNQFRALVRDSFEKITLQGQEVAPTIESVDSSFQEELTQYASDVGA